VPANDPPAPSGEPAVGVPSQRGRRWRKALITLVALFITVCAATAHLFVWPDQGMPPRVSAIVLLDSPGHPLEVALRLVAQRRAPFLVVSQGRPVARDPCPRALPGVTLICFNPKPATTQGEAEFVGRLAKQYHWHSIAVVAITPQASRARLRVERCFPCQVYVMTAPIRLNMWPYQIAYEWGALIKALLTQRAC
jgi:hypothetical protein